jgi:HD superfamily phosphohydrolase
VYLHKTGLVAEQLLIKTLQRAKELHHQGAQLSCSGPLLFFIQNKIEKRNFDENVLRLFAQLDDVDILAAIKLWQYQPDFVLSNLCKMIMNRQLLKIELKDKPIAPTKIQQHFANFKTTYELTDEETAYFVFSGSIENKAYDQEDQNINILTGHGKLVDVAKASDQLNLKALSKTVRKYYMCYPVEPMG